MPTVKGLSRAHPLRVLQFTDTHLYAKPEGALLGLQTQKSFEACLALAREEHWPADLILMTGDLVHDSSEEGYRRLRQVLDALDTPVSAIPGNHDDPHALSKLLEPSWLEKARLVGEGWQVIALDSTVPGTDAGELSQAQLNHLDRRLREHPELHTLVCLHHPPVTVGSAWIDTMRLRNPEAFFAVLDEHPQVRAVIWGHVHQEFRAERRGVLLLATPSTCVQFRPGSDEFMLDRAAPGYRWLRLYDNGKLETGVVRLTQVPDIDPTAQGY